MKRAVLNELGAAVLLDRELGAAGYHHESIRLGLVAWGADYPLRHGGWYLMLRRDGVPLPPDDETPMPASYWRLVSDPGIPLPEPRWSPGSSGYADESDRLPDGSCPYWCPCHGLQAQAKTTGLWEYAVPEGTQVEVSRTVQLHPFGPRFRMIMTRAFGEEQWYWATEEGAQAYQSYRLGH